MNQITLENIMLICQKCFSYLDARIDDHPSQVAYLYWRLLDNRGTYSKKELYDLVTIALLHDIGSYKTQDFDKFLNIDSPSYDHAIYGALFIKHFSPISHLSDIILYHHSDYESYESPYKPETSLLYFIDRMSIFFNYSWQIEDFFLSLNTEIDSQFISEFHEINRKENLIDNIQTGYFKQLLRNFFAKSIQSPENAIKYLSMISYTIDLRSECTLLHTIMVSAISNFLAQKMNYNHSMVQKISLAAMLHDIGKISTPINILEKPGKLTNEEMEIMREHVTITYEILENLGSRDVQEYASYHHEKLDGTGYPFGLKKDQLSIPARIIIVADIMGALMAARSYKESFPKDRIINILSELAAQSQIDQSLVDLVINEYDDICQHLSSLSNPYHKFKNEYMSIVTKMSA